MALINDVASPVPAFNALQPTALMAKADEIKKTIAKTNEEIATLSHQVAEENVKISLYTTRIKDALYVAHNGRIEIDARKKKAATMTAHLKSALDVLARKQMEERAAATVLASPRTAPPSPLAETVDPDILNISDGPPEANPMAPPAPQPARRPVPAAGPAAGPAATPTPSSSGSSGMRATPKPTEGGEFSGKPCNAKYWVTKATVSPTQPDLVAALETRGMCVEDINTLWTAQLRSAWPEDGPFLSMLIKNYIYQVKHAIVAKIKQGATPYQKDGLPAALFTGLAKLVRDDDRPGKEKAYLINADFNKFDKWIRIHAPLLWACGLDSGDLMPPPGEKAQQEIPVEKVPKRTRGPAAEKAPKAKNQKTKPQ